MNVSDKLNDEDKILTSMVLCFCYNYNSYMMTLLIFPPMFLISYYTQLIKQVELWEHPYNHRPFEDEEEKGNFIISRMVLMTMLMWILQAHYYLT